MSSFADARAKVSWANEHIRDIQKRIRGLEDSYSAIVDIHPQFGYQVVKYDLADKAAVQDISLHMGDAFHNLKCALDYAWIIILKRYVPSAISDKTQFPIHPSADSLKHALEERKIDTLCLELFNLMLTKIKPYAGGNDALCFVKKLNILDKHRLLLPLISYSGIAGLEMEKEGGDETLGGSGGPIMDPPPWYVRVPDGWRVKNKGKPSIAILFDKGTPAHFLDAPAYLEWCSAIVLQTVNTLAGFPLT